MVFQIPLVVFLVKSESESDKVKPGGWTQHNRIHQVSQILIYSPLLWPLAIFRFAWSTSWDIICHSLFGWGSVSLAAICPEEIPSLSKRDWGWMEDVYYFILWATLNKDWEIYQSKAFGNKMHINKKGWTDPGLFYLLTVLTLVEFNGCQLSLKRHMLLCIECYN